MASRELALPTEGSSMRIELDLNRRRLLIDGIAASSTRSKWALPALHLMLSRVGEQVNRELLESQLRGQGLTGRLDEGQIMRIWRALERMFDSADAAAGFSRRLLRRPGAASVGPWSWQAPLGDRIELSPTQQPSTGPAFAKHWFSGSDDALGALPLFLGLQEVMALKWKGLPQDALALLDEPPRWRDAAPALGALLEMLRTQLLVQLRRFDDARAALAAAKGRAAQAPAAQALLNGQLEMVAERLVYTEQPEQAYPGMLKRLPSLLQSCKVPVDPCIQAEALNLLGLCQRRELEAKGPHLNASARKSLLHTMQTNFFASLYLLMVARQFERAQCVCANIAYAYQQVAPQFASSMLGQAMQWHAASTRMHTTLDLPFDSAWEYIFIGDLWLGSEAGRAAAQALPPELSWQGHRPDELLFYVESVETAKRTADPRQKAHALLNLYRFAALANRSVVQTRARTELWDLLQQFQDLVALLRAEGYELPFNPYP